MPAAEQRFDQACLRDVRVLVLVEQHRAEPLAVPLPDGGVLRRDPDGQLDLVAEVDHAELALELLDYGKRAYTRIKHGYRVVCQL